MRAARVIGEADARAVKAARSEPWRALGDADAGVKSVV